MIETDLFEFAYVPDWYGQLEQLAEMALPEAWRFRKPQTECKNTDTPILERYLHMMFRKLSIDYNTGETAYFHVENNGACFHTGLYTRQYQAIYACFERNKKKDTTLKWYFTGFCDAVSSKLRYVEPLPKKPYFPMMQNGVNFNPEWPIRVNESIAVSAADLFNRYGKTESCHDLGRTKRILSGQHLSDTGNGISECENDCKTHCSMADQFGKKVRTSDEVQNFFCTLSVFCNS